MLSSSAPQHPAAATGGSEVEVAIIGAGPHGLSAAVHLRRAGVAAHVFGEPMGFWRGMPVGMRLRSNQTASNLIELSGPLSQAAFGATSGRVLEAPAALEDFVDYGLWVQRQAVPDVDRRLVDELSRTPDGFALALSDGELVRARRVVVAGGIAPFAHVPETFAGLPSSHVSHSGTHRDPAAFAGRRVAIVGGGQSACELAALIAHAGGEVEVLVRAPNMVWLRGHSVKRRIGRLGPIVYAPTDVGPLWYSRLVERPALFTTLPRGAQDRIAARCIRPACAHFVRVGLDGVTMSFGVQVRDASRRGEAVELALSDGGRRSVDHVILATGYRVDVRRYPFLSGELRNTLTLAGGFPVLRRGLQSSVDGLHFTGAPAAHSFGPIMRFVSGSWYAGTALAAALGSGRRALR